MQRRAVFKPGFVFQANTGGAQSGGKAPTADKAPPPKEEPKATVVAKPPSHSASVMSAITAMYG